MVETPSLRAGAPAPQSAFENATEITVLLISSASVFSWKEASPKCVCKNMNLYPSHEALEMDTRVTLLHRSACSFTSPPNAA